MSASGETVRRYWSPKKGAGEGITFLRAHLHHARDECLVWPLYRDPFGYPIVGFNGKPRRAHRVMCELAHGPAPSPEHVAAHSCGGGRQGCVNPRHLRWATPKENGQDTARMGRCRPKGAPRWKLTEQQVAEIKALKGVVTQLALAEQYGVAYSTIRDILQGRNWKHVEPAALLRVQRGPA